MTISVWPPAAADPVSQLVLACELLEEACASIRRGRLHMASLCLEDANALLAAIGGPWQSRRAAMR